MTIVVPGMDLDGERVECQPTHGMKNLEFEDGIKKSF